MADRATLKAALSACLTDADGVVAAVKAGSYASASAYEADANGIRARIAALIAGVDAEWGLDGNPTIRALRGLANRLLDLREGVAEDTATLVLTLARDTNLISLAVERYADMDRWTELAELNPHLRHPGFIKAGTEVTVYAR